MCISFGCDAISAFRQLHLIKTRTDILNPTQIMSLSATAPTLAKAVGVTFGTYCLSDFLSNFIQVRRRARLREARQ